MEIRHLRCNYLVTPLGVDSEHPQLGWELRADERGAWQSAYQVRAASDPKLLRQEQPDLWDSGKVASNQSQHRTYGGPRLRSRERVYWQVRVWDQTGAASAWSDITWFETGILNPGEWQAQWIGHPAGGTDIDDAVPAPLFRRTFAVDSAIASARVYIAGLGFYELTINGQRVGDAVLAPGFTRYDARILYNTYDVTAHLKHGKNALGVILGNGWYNTFTEDPWNFREAPWRDQPKLLLEFHVIYQDGREVVIGSGIDWKTSSSAIVFDGLRNGEFYDARREQPGWDTPEFDDTGWVSPRIVRSPGGRLVSEQMPPIRIVDTRRSVAVKEVRPGTFVFDVGQNLSGWARIQVQGPAGSEVTLRYGESVDADGALDNQNIAVFVKSGAFQTDKYILKGEGVETWEPRFVYHGFRYVEVTGLSEPPTLDTLSARVVHTALSSRGSFECSDPLLNAIQTAALWSTLSNYHSIPTDCPHREKNGWTGDAALSSEQVLLNFDPMAAYHKWLNDFDDAQRPSGQLPGIVPTGGWGFNWGSGPAWDVALFLLPWYLFEYCGDRSALTAHYPQMCAYLTFAQSMMVQGLVEFGLGDWCPPTGGPGGHQCPTTVTDTAYVYVMADIAAKVAAILDRPEEERSHRALAQTVRDAFRRAFCDFEQGTVRGDCQTSTACALYQGLLEPEERSRFLATLIRQVEAADYHLDTGILGAKYVMHVLSAEGRSDLAYRIASQTSFPSWGHWLSQGATTLWECWNGDGSHNHHMYSDVSAWFYQGLAGILTDPLEPGFQHVVFRPQPVPGMDWAQAYHHSLYGEIGCRWEREGNAIVVTAEVPVNCHATLLLPKGAVLGDLEGQEAVGADVAAEGIRFGSGRYRFSFSS